LPDNIHQYDETIRGGCRLKTDHFFSTLSIGNSSVMLIIEELEKRTALFLVIAQRVVVIPL